MKSKLLLPYRYKTIGWLILIPSFIVGVILIIKSFGILELQVSVPVIYGDEIFGDTVLMGWYKTNITPTIVGVLFLTGALLVTFTKEKVEDEYIAELRQTSLLWAVFVNFILLIVCFLFIYGGSFLSVMLYNMFTVLIIFIVRFQYLLYRNKIKMSYEK